MDENSEKASRQEKQSIGMDTRVILWVNAIMIYNRKMTPRIVLHTSLFRRRSRAVSREKYMQLETAVRCD